MKISYSRQSVSFIKCFSYLLVGLCAILFTSPSYASSVGNLPFNTSLDLFRENFSAAVFSIGIILFIATCLMMAFGEWGDGIKRLITIAFFISLALGGPAAITLLFGTGATF